MPNQIIKCDKLEQIINDHKPHPKSLKDEESTEPYNEEEARRAFGDDFIDQLKQEQPEFTGDWWQLALLIGNLGHDARNALVNDSVRLGPWKTWRTPRADIDGCELVHLERGALVDADLGTADLFAAHLEHANLHGARLEYADLREAHLEHADMPDAHLEHAKLSRGHLEHLDLS